MTEFNKKDMDELPKPSDKRGNVFKLTILTLLIVTITAATLYWLSRDEESKKNIVEAVTENVDNAIKDTPLEQVTTLMNPPPPPTVATPPASSNVVVSAEPTEETTSPVTPGLDPNVPVGTVMPKVEEDSRVPMTFIDDAATWMVGRYKPGVGLRFNLAAINYRYGQTMRGLIPAGQGDVISARIDLLRYAFNTPMITALYNLYVDRFIAALGDAAEFPSKGKPFTPDVVADMYKAYAKQFNSLGGVLHGIAATTNFLDLVQQAESLGQESVDIHSKITAAVFDLDLAREAKDKTGQEAAQMRIDGLNAQYQRVLTEREQANRSLVNAVQNKAPAARGVDADTIIFIAEWIERRQVPHDEAVQIINTTAGLFDDLSARLNTAAKDISN